MNMFLLNVTLARSMGTLLKAAQKLKRPSLHPSRLLKTMLSKIFSKLHEGIRNNGVGELFQATCHSLGRLITLITCLKFWNFRKRDSI
jgi:hypothetical protein